MLIPPISHSKIRLCPTVEVSLGVYEFFSVAGFYKFIRFLQEPLETFMGVLFSVSLLFKGFHH